MQLFTHETFRLYARLYIVATTHSLLCLLPSLTFFFCSHDSFLMCAGILIHSLSLLILSILVPCNCLLMCILVLHLEQIPDSRITRWKVKEQQGVLAPQCHRASQRAAPLTLHLPGTSVKEFNTHF